MCEREAEKTTRTPSPSEATNSLIRASRSRNSDSGIDSLLDASSEWAGTIHGFSFSATGREPGQLGLSGGVYHNDATIHRENRGTGGGIGRMRPVILCCSSREGAVQETGRPGGTRTPNRLIWNQVLYQLSHWPATDLQFSGSGRSRQVPGRDTITGARYRRQVPRRTARRRARRSRGGSAGRPDRRFP